MEVLFPFMSLSCPMLCIFHTVKFATNVEKKKNLMNVESAKHIA